MTACGENTESANYLCVLFCLCLHYSFKYIFFCDKCCRLTNGNASTCSYNMCFCRPILAKIGKFWYILLKVHICRCRCGSRVVTCVLTEGNA